MKLYARDLEDKVIKTLCENSDASRLLMGRLKEDMFNAECNRKAFKRIARYFRDGEKFISHDVLLDDPAIPEKDRKELRLFKGGPLPLSAVDKTIQTLDGYRFTRDVLHFANNLAGIVKEDQIDVADLKSAMLDQFTQIMRGRDDVKFWCVGKGSNVKELFAEIRKGEDAQGIPSFFDAWDSMNGVIPRTALMIVAADTGEGKSLMSAVMCRNMAYNGFRPVIVPLEMSTKQMLSRLKASVSGIPVHKVHQGQKKLTKNELKKSEEAMEKWEEEAKGSYLIYDGKGGQNMTQILHTILPREPDIIIIDYIALLDGMGGEDDWRKMSEATREAKKFAVAHEIPVIIVAQMGSEGKLRYSNRMKDDADIMWSWEKVKGEDGKPSEIIKIKQDKCRNQDPRPFKLRVDWACMDITDYTKDDEKREAGKTDKKAKRKKSVRKRSVPKRSIKSANLKRTQPKESVSVEDLTPEEKQQSHQPTLF